MKSNINPQDIDEVFENINNLINETKALSKLQSLVQETNIENCTIEKQIEIAEAIYECDKKDHHKYLHNIFTLAELAAYYRLSKK